MPALGQEQVTILGELALKLTPVAGRLEVKGPRPGKSLSQSDFQF